MKELNPYEMVHEASKISAKREMGDRDASNLKQNKVIKTVNDKGVKPNYVADACDELVEKMKADKQC